MRAGDAKMTALHDAAVKQGAMQQLLVWIGFFELFGFVAIVQMLQGGDRLPGDFGFDPLNCAKDPNVSVNPLQSLSIAPLFSYILAPLFQCLYFFALVPPLDLILQSRALFTHVAARAFCLSMCY